MREARVLTCLKPTRSTRAGGEGVEVRRSPQAVACRNRYVEELGRPHRLLAVGRVVVGHTDIEARRGKPGNGAMPEPKAANCNAENRKAEKYCERERLPHADGESYQA
jgi:hypothetical protein